MTAKQLQPRVEQIEAQLDQRAAAGWSSYPAALDLDVDRQRLKVTLADGTVEFYDLATTGQVVEP